MNILNIPNDIYTIILNLLETKEICKLIMVSKELHKIISNKSNKLKIDFTDCKISNNYLKYFINIYSINLSNCNQITDKGLEY